MFIVSNKGQGQCYSSYSSLIADFDQYSEALSELSQISKMEFYMEVFNS